MTRWYSALLGVLMPGAILLIWWLAAFEYHGTLFVGPADVWQCAVAMLISGELTNAVSSSLLRCGKGLVLGVSAGAAVGVLLGLSSLGRLMVGPSLRALQQVSLFSWIPMIMVWFGLGEASKVVFIALAAFFPMLVNAFEGVGSIPLAYVEVGKVHRFNGYQMVSRVILPAALPSIFTGFYLALIYSWMATLGSEYLMISTVGLGNLLVDGQEEYRMDKVLLGVVLVSVIGLLLSSATAVMEAVLLRWRR